MIAKRSPRRKDGGSNFGSLARYIMDAKGAGEKVEWHSITNCESTEIEWAIDEIQCTQDANTRTKGDKTYHLIVSFPPGEDPTKEQLQDIEAELCKAIGLGDHQRLSAVHSDTEHKHIHIAINKIHPLTHNMVEPYYDQYKLMEVCQKLELKHGLEATNHGTPGQPSARKNVPVDELRAGGITPLADHLREALDLSAVNTWGDLHAMAGANGCAVTKRGNGLVFVDASGQRVKASAVDRGLSLGRLEAKLGQYEPSKDPIPKLSSNYRPTPSGVDREALWKEYQAEKVKTTLDKRVQLAELKKLNKAKKDAINKNFKGKRVDLKHGQLVKNPKARKGWYSILKLEKAKELEILQKSYKEALADFHKKTAIPDWRDWLKQQAEGGNTKALDALQTAKPRAKSGNAFYNDAATPSPIVLDTYKYHIHRNGNVTYKLKDGGFTDEGKRIRLGKEPSQAAIEAALRMAVMKYGTNINLAGTAEFRAKAEVVAKTLGITVLNSTEKAPVIAPSKSQEKTTKIDEYINERNEKRKSIFDILKHRVFENSDKGVCELAGVRTFGDQKAVLIKRDNEILIKPITDQEAKKLASLKVGNKFSIDDSGQLKTGRSL